MLSGQKTTRAYGKEEVMIGRFDQHNEDAIEAYYNAEYHGCVIGPSVNFINNLSLSFISMFGAILYIFTPSFTLGSLSSFVLYSRKFSGPVNETANIISEIQSATSAAERVFRLLDTPCEKKADEADKPIENVQGDIKIDDITFGYDEKPVLKNISVTIPKGSTVAVVGPTGSGKTTIINLLMRFYDVQSGEIRIDGTNSAESSLEDVRKSFAMVLQDTWLFAGTVAENIAYGAENASREDIEKAAKAAKIHDFIMSLPQGYDTLIDENGVNISKGQKQLITIARAILMDSPMLILDEATSNVDSRTERQLQEAVNAVMKDRTSIVVAHRLSTVRHADVILVIKDGVLIEAGNHDELMAIKDGFYKSLHNSQFLTVDS
jgi:ATP-binding cassette subfamily B protein